MSTINNISLVLVIIGALNWGSVALFNFDIVATLFGGSGAMFSRVIYTLIAVAGLWCISLLFKDKVRLEDH